MNPVFEEALVRNGYIIKDADRFLLIRRKVMLKLDKLIRYVLAGALMFSSTILTVGMMPSVVTVMGLMASMIILSIPFLEYLTSSYRSLSINHENRSLHFRSAYSRAYRFEDISNISIEINSLVNSGNKLRNQDFSITIHFNNRCKEELVRLAVGDGLNEHTVLQIKDYFQVLLTRREF